MNFPEIICLSSLPASLRKFGSEVKVLARRHRFPHYMYKSMGAFCCHRNHSFDRICPKCLCSLSPIPVMLQIKLAIKIFLFESVNRRRTDKLLVYYKANLKNKWVCCLPTQNFQAGSVGRKFFFLLPVQEKRQYFLRLSVYRSKNIFFFLNTKKPIESGVK